MYSGSLADNIAQQIVKRVVNGIYSYFIRATDVSIAVDELNKLRKYALKVIEAGDVILYVGRFWIVYVEEEEETYGDVIHVKCYNDECIELEPIEPEWVYHLNSKFYIVEDVKVEYEKWSESKDGTTEYSCRSVYSVVRYRGTVAMTIDPLDIITLASDDELKLLLEIISRSGLLIRPM
jgi:hypothetical protein